MSPASHAVLVLDRNDLQAACEAYPASPTGFYCVLYIQRFLDGAVATDKRLVINPMVEQYSDTTIDTPSLARDVVYAALRRHYLREG